MNPTAKTQPEHSAARNTCKLCMPYGATLAALGIEGCVPLLHGSQGCSTYIRRHMIGHFREPVDVASSNFHESAAIFGGKDNLLTAIENIKIQYKPKLIVIATTCLAETIGDNVDMFLHEHRQGLDENDTTELVHVSTASYRGDHATGFFAAQRAIVSQMVEAENLPKDKNLINIIPAMISPEDFRTLKDEAELFGLKTNILCDYSDRLDGGQWPEFMLIPPGGTPPEQVRRMNSASATIELTNTRPSDTRAGLWLEENAQVPCSKMPVPIGLVNCDKYYTTLSEISGRAIPKRLLDIRSRLQDAYVDGHKYLFGKKVILCCDEEMSTGIISMLLELGVEPVICATPGNAEAVKSAISSVSDEYAHTVSLTKFMPSADFITVEKEAASLDADFIIGNSNAMKMARSLDLPLLRVGMPIHDRIGAARIKTLGYSGTLELFDRLCNLVIEQMQDHSEISPRGYTHM